MTDLPNGSNSPNNPGSRNPPALPEAAPAQAALAALWHGAGLPAETLSQIELAGQAPVLPSSFCVATAAQTSLGAAALAAALLWQQRSGVRQRVGVDRIHATLACTGHFALDGRVPELWDKLSGLYACGADTASPGWVRIHTNFSHHRDSMLRTLGLPEGRAAERDAVTQALRSWTAEAFEQAATDAGAVVAAARSFAQWDAHPQALAMLGQPVVSIEPIGPVAGPGGAAAPLPWPAPATGSAAAQARPLDGLRVLDLTRILAGPVAGRCLAAYGADVMLVNSPHLPNIEAIADTSRGKLSTLIDLREAAGRAQLDHLLSTSRVFVHGYRPGALAGLGLSAEALALRRPGIVVASISAYGQSGSSSAIKSRTLFRGVMFILRFPSPR